MKFQPIKDITLISKTRAKFYWNMMCESFIVKMAFLLHLSISGISVDTINLFNQ